MHSVNINNNNRAFGLQENAQFECGEKVCFKSGLPDNVNMEDAVKRFSSEDVEIQLESFIRNGMSQFSFVMPDKDVFIGYSPFGIGGFMTGIAGNMSGMNGMNAMKGNVGMSGMMAMNGNPGMSGMNAMNGNNGMSGMMALNGNKPEENSKECPSCGGKANSSSRFCPNCGNPLL